MKIIHCEQGSEAWFDERCGRITASQFATLMGKPSNKGYNDMILRVAGEVITGDVEEQFQSDAMKRGTELEPEARQYYEQLFDIEVEQVGFCIPEFDNDLEEWTGISPDGLVGNDGLLEIKCPLRNTHLNYLLSDRLPLEYKWQVQGQLFITKRKWCDFMSYYPKLKPFIVRVYPDLVMHAELEKRLVETINEIKTYIFKYNIDTVYEIP